MAQTEPTTYARVTFPLDHEGMEAYIVLVPVPPLPAVMVEPAVRGLATACLHREAGDTLDEDAITRAADGLTIEWGVTDADTR
jgi:hypothetical protein